MRKVECFFWGLAVIWAVLAVIPASAWYDKGTLRIDDVSRGDTLEIIHTGHIARDFIGSYTVVMRNANTHEIVAEDRSSRFEYLTTSNRPNPITIQWWAPGSAAMHDLQVGSYVMHTCWTIHGEAEGDTFWQFVRSNVWRLLPGKTVCAESNPFRILEPVG